jgi:sugar transferase (PEP-CTERM system associated)
VVRLFQVYYPVRTLILLIGEALLACASFLLATLIVFRQDSILVLNYEYGFYKVLGLTGIVIICSHFFDLYGISRLGLRGEIYVRVFLALGALSFILAGIEYAVPKLVPGQGVLLLSLVILTFVIPGWRMAFAWLLRKPYLKERVYVIGSGSLASELVETIRERSELGMEIVGWVGAIGDTALTREDIGQKLRGIMKEQGVTHVIVALSDRRGKLPVAELLDLRLSGIKVEEAGTVLEKVLGKIQVDSLHPSALVFSEGFRINQGLLFVRRVFSLLVALTILLCALPLIPFIILAIKLSSSGPVLFRQERVGRNGETFFLYKFRTMVQDAEARSGPTWAFDNDPRVTRLGRFMRRTRLDEIPQLWNVLKGDMGFVGPRPERPEFVQWLANAIPYYELRHVIRPGITGWAQVRYKYGASVEDSKQKLQYDLYYIKHMSVALDLVIMFETIKTILLARGSR